MDKFTIAKIMLQKIKPQMYNEDWIRAVKLMGELDKKSVKYPEEKKKTFCWLVDQIYEKEEAK